MKILLLDIETSPIVTYAWSLWKEAASSKMMKSDWSILCWCAKWFGESEIYSGMQANGSDRGCLKELHKLLDEADIVVAHNGDQFDVKKINTRFIINGYLPPSSYRTIDTLKSARKYFKFTSNRLDDLGGFLGVGHKIDVGGFDLWKECMAGNKKAMYKMVRYCKRDVVLLEKIYIKLRPYILNHPNISLSSINKSCPKCRSVKFWRRGYHVTKSGNRQRYQCLKCGGWFL